MADDVPLPLELEGAGRAPRMIDPAELARFNRLLDPGRAPAPPPSQGQMWEEGP